MTQDELIAALPAGRLPSSLMHVGVTDAFALFGAGLIVAALLSAVALPFLARRPSKRQQIRATRGLPPEERILAIARILGRLPDPLRTAAYGSEAPPAGAEMERIALKAARRWK